MTSSDLEIPDSETKLMMRDKVNLVHIKLGE